VLYAAVIPLAFVREWIAAAIYVMVALTCLVPDRRIESRFHDSAWS
jgi:TMEM175 potassium channel family protein